MMTIKELKKAMDDGEDVRWANDLYKCFLHQYKSCGTYEYLVTCTSNDHTIGIFHRDGIGMNIDPKKCYIK